MIVKKLKINNWKHFNFEKEISFEPSLNILTGPNFVGKTSVLEALQFALTGVFTSHKSDSNKMWIYSDADHASLELSFSHDATEYIVRRILKPRTGKNDITDELFQLVNGEEKSITSGSSVTEFIQKIIPWSKYTLNKIMFLTDEVVTDIATGQKEIFKSLKDLLSFEEAKIYSNKLTSDLKDFSDKAKGIEKRLKDFKESNTDLDKQKNELEASIVKQVKVVKDLDAKFLLKNKEKEKIIDLKNKRDEILKLKAELTNILSSLQISTISDLDSQIQSVKTDLETKRKEQIDGTTKIGELNGQIKSSTDILTILSHSSEPACPVCNKTMSESEKNSISDRLTTKISSFQAEINTFNTKLGDIRKFISEFQSKEQLLINQKQKYDTKSALLVDKSKGFDESVDYPQQYEDIKNTLSELDEQLKTERNSLDSLNSKLLTIEKEIEFHKEDLPRKLREAWTNWHKANITLEALKLTENEFILKKLHAIQDEIKDHWSTFQENPIDVLLGTQKGIEIKLKRDTKEFEIQELSGSEKRIFILLIVLLLNKSVYKSPIQTIDEPFEPLDPINVQKLENFLIGLASDHQIICTAIEPFTSEKCNIIEL